MLPRFGSQRVTGTLVGSVREAFDAEPGKTIEVGLPVMLTLAAEIPQEIPAVQPRIVAIIEVEADGVMPGRFDLADADMLLAHLEHLLARPVAAYLGRGRHHAQVLEGEGIPLPIGEYHLKQPGLPAHP